VGTKRMTISVDDKLYRDYHLYKKDIPLSEVCQRAIRVKILQIQGAKTRISNEERLLNDIRLMRVAIVKIVHKFVDNEKKKRLSDTAIKELVRIGNLKKKCRVCQRMHKAKDCVVIQQKDDKGRDMWVCNECNDGYLKTLNLQID